MDIKELDTNAARDGGARQGHPGRRRVDRHDQEALRQDRARVHVRGAPRLPRAAVHRARRRQSTSRGVILYDETLRQQAADGTPFPQLLAARGILPGIKVDAGAKALAGFPGETMTEGLDGLRERLAEYRGLGARFAKWRAVIDIGAGIPSQACLAANAQALARYAALCQEADDRADRRAGSADGRRPRIERCEEVTDAALATVFDALLLHRVRLEGMVLKPNMVIAGKKCAQGRRRRQQVAEATVRCLRRRVPAAVPGIAFLSGGQSEAEATLHLSLMNRGGTLPWQLSFSYGRALQQSTLDAWKGKPGNVAAGQKTFLRRAKLNGLARDGSYEAAMEQAAA